MFKVDGKVTGVYSNPNKKNPNENNYYVNILSPDGSKVQPVKIKAETFSRIAKDGIDKPISLSVFINVFDNKLWVNEA